MNQLRPSLLPTVEKVSKRLLSNSLRMEYPYVKWVGPCTRISLLAAPNIKTSRDSAKKTDMSVFTRNAAQPQLNTTNLRKMRIKYSDCLKCNKGVWNYYKHQGSQVCNMYDNNENCWQFNSENASRFQQMPLHNTVRKHSSKPDIVIGFRTIRTWEAWEATVGIWAFALGRGEKQTWIVGAKLTRVILH